MGCVQKEWGNRLRTPKPGTVSTRPGPIPLPESLKEGVFGIHRPHENQLRPSLKPRVGVRIDGGASSFIMSLDSSMGPADHLCWITSAVSESTSDNINWEIGFTVTAERTYDQEDPWQGQALAAYEAFGDDAVPLINSFYSFVNNPPFRFNEPPYQ